MYWALTGAFSVDAQRACLSEKENYPSGSLLSETQASPTFHVGRSLRNVLDESWHQTLRALCQKADTHTWPAPGVSFFWRPVLPEKPGCGWSLVNVQNGLLRGLQTWLCLCRGLGSTRQVCLKKLTERPPCPEENCHSSEDCFPLEKRGLFFLSWWQGERWGRSCQATTRVPKGSESLGLRGGLH